MINAKVAELSIQLFGEDSTWYGKPARPTPVRPDICRAAEQPAGRRERRRLRDCGQSKIAAPPSGRGAPDWLLGPFVAVLGTHLWRTGASAAAGRTEVRWRHSPFLRAIGLGRLEER